MFHKEDSALLSNKKKRTAAVDVPLKKSRRRQLYQRALSYFHLSREESSPLQQLLENVFVQGNLSQRLIPLESKQWSMVLYVKASIANDSSDSLSTVVWPFQSFQFVWMAMEEKNNVVDESPTVAMWAALSQPHILSREDMNDFYIVKVPSAVSKYICRGADLMKAGMRSLPEIRQRSATVAIVVGGNPQPFAVGKLTTQNINEIGVNTKGIGVHIWNSYGDDLWRQTCVQLNITTSGNTNETGGGASFDNGDFGNVGFWQGKFVSPLHGDKEEDDISDQEDIDGSVNAYTVHEVITTETTTASPINIDNSSASDETNPSRTIDENAPQLQSLPVKDDVSTTFADEILHQAVCQALVNLSNKDFPILVATFYSKHVLPIILSPIELKQTSYKKVGVYIKVQVERGLIVVGPDTKNKKNIDPMAMLMEYRKHHEDLKEIKKTKSTVSTSVGRTKLILVNLYRIPNNWLSLLRLDLDDVRASNATSEERKGTGMLTSPEVKKILEAYIAREELIHPVRKDQINLDGPLTDSIYTKSQQKQQAPPSTLKRKDLAKQFMAKLQPAYALVQMPGSKIVTLKNGSPPKIEIEVCMRQSKKFLTRVRGMEEYNIDGPALSKAVARRLACSATVDREASAGRAALKKGRVEIVFQGNIVEELEALLTGDESLSSHGGVKNSDYAIPLQVLDVVLRKGVPARKKRGGGKKKK